MTNLYIYNAPFAELKFDNETLYMRADKCLVVVFVVNVH